MSCNIDDRGRLVDVEGSMKGCGELVSLGTCFSFLKSVACLIRKCHTPTTPVGCFWAKNRFFVTHAESQNKHAPSAVLSGRGVPRRDPPAP